MTDTHSLHGDAMQIADRAIEARREDRRVEARSLFRQACQLESQAAMTFAEDLDAEPTRSVLFRSAATLALHGELLSHAAYLVARGLEGAPPAEIRDELREVLKSIHLEGESLSDARSATVAASADRLERFLATSCGLASTLDDFRKTLAESDLTSGQISNSLIRRILLATRDGLREYTPDADFFLDLFVLSPDVPETWVSISQDYDALLHDWRSAANEIFAEQEKAILRGLQFAASTQDLADHGVLSPETAAQLQNAGVHGVAAWPVCARSNKGNLVPALALLSLTSNPAIFADDVATRLLRQTVSFLELAIVVGQRDEHLARRREPERDTSPPD